MKRSRAKFMTAVMLLGMAGPASVAGADAPRVSHPSRMIPPSHPHGKKKGARMPRPCRTVSPGEIGTDHESTSYLPKPCRNGKPSQIVSRNE